MKVGKIIEKRTSEILIHPSSKKTRIRKGNTFIAYYFTDEVEKITMGADSIILTLKLKTDGSLTKQSNCQLNLLLNGRILV